MADVIRNGFLWTCHTVGLSGTNGVPTLTEPLQFRVSSRERAWSQIRAPIQSKVGRVTPCLPRPRGEG